MLTITAKNEGDCSAANPAGVIYALVQNTSGCYKCPSGQIFNFKTCSCAVNIIFNFSVKLQFHAVIVQNPKYGLMLQHVVVVVLEMFYVFKMHISITQDVPVDVYLKDVPQI